MSNQRSINLLALVCLLALLILLTIGSIRVFSTASASDLLSIRNEIQPTSLEAGEGSLSAGPIDALDSPTATTYYIRPDGGSAVQCTGLTDAPYPGNGTAQACAWNHPFQALPPGGTVRIQGGDTLFIKSGNYQMGYGAPGAESCDFEGSYECFMPPIPSGPDSAHPTRLLGEGWNSGCGAPPQLWGSGRSNFVVNLTGSNNVEVACLEVTDHSSCIEYHLLNGAPSIYTCQRDTPPYGDWAVTGLYAENSANVHLKDLNIHGLASRGVLAGGLTNWTVENVRLVGNGAAGWDGDIGDPPGSENHGTFTFRRWLVAWNGCGETYPDKQHIACWGQEAGGYGDGAGFGGTTGGHYIIEDSAFLYNTSDGLDMLYVRLPDAIIEIHRTIAEGNDGNQLKLTASQATIENSIVVSNCGYFHGMPFWNNDDDCRANGDALALFLQPGAQFKVINSTITGEGGQLVIAGCALDQQCNGTEAILMRNTLFQGQKIFYLPEEDVRFAWYDDESIPGLPANPFVVDYSLITGVLFGNVNPCPGNHNLCDVDAGIANAAIDRFNARLLSGSLAIDAGTTVGAPLTDFTNHPRDALPDIGAYELYIPAATLYIPIVQR